MMTKILSSDDRPFIILLVLLLLLSDGLPQAASFAVSGIGSSRRCGRSDSAIQPENQRLQKTLEASTALSPSLPVTALQFNKNFKMRVTDTREAEERRKDMRTVYNHDDWVYHRRPGRFLDEFGPPLTRIITWFVYFFCLGLISGTIEIVWPVGPS